MTAFECISCSFFICIYKLFFIFFPPRRLVSHFGSSFKTPPLHQFNKEVHTAKLGCYLKRLFFLNSFQQFYLSSIKIKKCLDLCISLTSDLVTCISLYLLPWYLFICVAANPSDPSLAHSLEYVDSQPIVYIKNYIHFHLFLCCSWLTANLIRIPFKHNLQNFMLPYGIL